MQTRYGNASYAGSYRLAYLADGRRFLEVRKHGAWVRIDKEIPSYVKGGCYGAANFLKI